jgi:hypothetical protein
MILTEQEAREMRWEDFRRRQYEMQLSAHPDCRDPDHIGCELCDEENDDE